MSYKTLCTRDTGYHADTVEWCPIEGFEEFLVCGTYQLIEKGGQKQVAHLGEDNVSQFGRRVGDIQLYQLEQLKSLTKQGSYCQGAGILDTKCPFMCCSTLTCVVSDSKGELTLLQCSKGSWETRQISQWAAHGYEAWIAAFDRWSHNVVYSGGDDCLLRGWDTRTNCTNPIFTSKRHEMGVSSIQCNPVHEHIMATGSYDEKILVWDTRNRRTPLTSASPGGGVWRIKWHPVTGNHMLTASMYSGYHILKFINCQGNLKKTTSYTENAVLAYGADWCYKNL
ncbi:predicted protein, partial [Nematostella vectensis]